MKARLLLWKNEVGLEADYIMQEAAELIDFTAHNDIRPRVVLKVGVVHLNGLFELIALPG